MWKTLQIDDKRLEEYFIGTTAEEKKTLGKPSTALFRSLTKNLVRQHVNRRSTKRAHFFHSLAETNSRFQSPTQSKKSNEYENCV